MLVRSWQVVRVANEHSVVCKVGCSSRICQVLEQKHPWTVSLRICLHVDTGEVLSFSSFHSQHSLRLHQLEWINWYRHNEIRFGKMNVCTHIVEQPHWTLGISWEAYPRNGYLTTGLYCVLFENYWSTRIFNTSLKILQETVELICTAWQFLSLDNFIALGFTGDKDKVLHTLSAGNHWFYHGITWYFVSFWVDSAHRYNCIGERFGVCTGPHHLNTH